MRSLSGAEASFYHDQAKGEHKGLGGCQEIALVSAPCQVDRNTAGPLSSGDVYTRDSTNQISVQQKKLLRGLERSTPHVG